MSAQPWPAEAKTVIVVGMVAIVAGVLRYFMKGWLANFGISFILGSFVASVTVVLLVGAVLLFWRSGGHRGGSYLRAAAWYIGLAAWCECVVIAGILVTEWRHSDTYYRGPWPAVEQRFPSGLAHAMGHIQGFLPRTALGLLVGALVFWVARFRGAP
jgi:hypothetical protein